MKRMIFVLVSFLLLTACGSSYDEEGFELAKGYFDEIVKEVSDAHLAITSKLPEEFDESLIKYAENIREINGRYWDGITFGGKYDSANMSKWKIKMSRDGDEWVIDGEELSDALAGMHLYSGWLADDIERILEELTEENLRQLVDSLKLTQESASELRAIFLNDKPFFEFKPRQ